MTPELDAITAARLSGQLAIGLLILSLFASLHPKTRPYRRTLGLLAFCAGTAHAIYTTSSPLVEDLTHLYYEPHLRAGATVLAILTILAATSFPARFAVREWKALHRLVYAAALLAILHIALSSHATRLSIALPLAAITTALLLRISKWRTR
jgi:methionine sulfoxide reductase heme-binding subunit